MQIQHDPVYVAYLLSSMETTENPTANTPTIILIVIPIILVTAVSLVLVIARTHKRSPKKQE